MNMSITWIHLYEQLYEYLAERKRLRRANAGAGGAALSCTAASTT